MATKNNDWSIPDSEGIMHIPDKFDNLFNSIGNQLRFVQFSGKSEVIAIAHIIQKAEKFFLPPCSALAVVAEEKRRQIEELGFNSLDPEMAHLYEQGQLAEAAIQYLAGESIKAWPALWESAYKPTDRITNLTKATAMLLQEIDRLKYLEEKQKEVVNG